MKIKFILFLTGLTALVVFSGMALAQEPNFPIPELGNCQSQSDCAVYCDKPENLDVCLSFAKKNDLMSEEEIDRAEKFLNAENTPGSCKTKGECEAYCNDIDHIDECVSFAEENNLLPPEELEEAKKVRSAIANGIKPPACGSKKACDAYCESPDHMEECMDFAVKAGFIEGKELEDAQKMLQAVKRGVKPPPCRGREACDDYCQQPENMEVCINFALEAGFMPEEERENSQKMLQAVKKGVKPPPCRGEEECNVYCQQEDHFEECTNFAVAAGFMSEEDAQMARKTGGKGPGGCKNKEECDKFCGAPENQQTCFEFAKANGLISEDQLREMERGNQFGDENIQRGPGNNQSGPGGCQSPEECEAYCKDNPEECGKFQPGPGEINPGGRMMPQQAGPGGCKSPEECQKYCESNPEECKNFGSGQRGPDIQQNPDIQRQMPPPEEFRPPEGQPSENQQPLPAEPTNGFIPEGSNQPPSSEQPPPPESNQPAPVDADSFAGSLLYALFRILIGS